MPVRSLNGLDTSVRSLNGLSDRIDYTVSLPLTMNSDYNIKLSNLNSYGSANQILRMNGTTSIEWSNETDTTYTTQTPLVIINGVIGLNGIVGYGNTIGQRQLIRTNSTNNGLEYFPEPDFSNFITTATLPNLVAGLTTFGSDSAGLTNLGATNYATNLYGNVTIKNITTVNSGNLYVYGSGGLITASTYSYSFPVGGGTLVSSNTLPSSISVLNNFGTLAISNVSVGKATLDTLLYGNIKIQNISSVSSGNIFICGTNNIINKSNFSYTLPSSTGTLALTSDIPNFVNYFAKTNNDIRPITTTDNLLLGTTANPNSRKFVVNGLMDIQGSIYFTTGGGHIFNANNHGILGRTVNGETDIGTSQSPSLIQGSTSTTFKGTSNVVQIESTLRFMHSGGMLRNQQGNTLISFDNTSGSEKNTFGIASQVTEILGNVKIPNISPNTTGNILILGANQSVTSIAQIPITSIELINYWNIAYRPFEVDYTNLSMVALYAIFTKPVTNVNLFIGDSNFKYRHNIRHTTNSIGFYISTNNDYTTGNINSFNINNTGCSTDRITFTNPGINNLYNKIDHGGAYAYGPDIMGHTGVKIWTRDPGNNYSNDVRFYVLSNLINMRVPICYLNGSLVQTSDDRLKTDEIDFTFNSLEIINKMKPKQYKKYNEDGEFLYMELGMIAQDTWNTVKDNEILRDIFVGDVDYNLESNFKENGDLVEDQQKINDKGEIITNYLYVNYISYVPILIQSVKDLNTIVKQQQEQINQQQIIIDKLINSSTFANFRKNI